MKVTVKLARGEERAEATVETPNGFIPGDQSLRLVLNLLGWHGWEIVAETEGEETK